MSFRFACLLIPVVLALSGAAGRAAHADEESVDFAADIKPILVANCIECHGLKKREGGLRLTRGKDLVNLNDSGEPAVTARQPAKSELIRRITLANNDDERMPPEGKRLSTQQIALLTAWIKQGAHWPESEAVRPIHWSYIKPTRSSLPAVKQQEWIQNAIDAFVLARLEKEGLQPSPKAAKARLIRRVYLDLIGLPPSIQEVNAFLKDERPGAYEAVVDRLLKSPRYGERWARQWLDLARYADSNGYQADQFRTMWAWRDWVIDAFNADMPFDQFTIEQIAGDLLPDASLSQKIATGFHRCPTCNVEAGVDPEENRVNQLIDRVNTTGTVWLGTSLECAQCHNHKYDPFTQKDYYQIFAFFNNTPMEVKLTSGVTFDFYGPKFELPLPKDKQQRLDKLQKDHDEIVAKLKSRTETLATAQTEWEQQSASKSNSQPEWHVLDVQAFESEGGASHTVLDDKSVLVGGDNPDTDIYTLSVRTDLTDITSFKIEALLDPSLPGKGPGRQKDRANFLVTDFRITAQCCGDSSVEAIEVALHNPKADFANKAFPVEFAIDADKKTGWSIHTQYHKPHHATFLSTQPIGFEGGTVLTFRIEQLYGQQRQIGRLRLQAMTGEPPAEELPAKILAILKTAPDNRKKKQKKQLSEYFVGLDPQVKQLQAARAKLKKQLDVIKPVSTLVMIEMDKPRLNNIFKRGNFLDKGPDVVAATPEVLHPIDNKLPRNRIGLAKWLVDPANPLVARVAVNRWWAEFFGRGIVASLEDFGSQGEPPTHPQLLDRLAVDFVENNWSMKHIHNTIVMSATYQQSSRMTRESLERDPYNKLYGRGARFRLSAETIRDNALKISGLLSAKMHGPPIFPPQPPNIWRHIGRNAPKYKTSTGEDRFRRGIYVVWRRSAPYPSFVNFDAPDRAACVVQRSRTNTPLQALTLMNDPAYTEMATALAKRILTDDPKMTIAEKIDYGFRLCVSRNPTPREAEILERVYREELARFEADTKAAEDLIAAKDRPKDADIQQLAAWFYIANVLMNMDETITKG